MADSSVASAPKKGFFNQYAPLWPSTVGLACAYMGLVVATQGSLRFTDQGVFTDAPALLPRPFCTRRAFSARAAPWRFWCASPSLWKVPSF